jgi:hypothetical protein
MIDRNDNIVTISYPKRSIVGQTETTATYALVGSSEAIAAQVARTVERWLEKGSSSPMTIHTAGRFNVINANEAQAVQPA